MNMKSKNENDNLKDKQNKNNSDNNDNKAINKSKLDADQAVANQNNTSDTASLINHEQNTIQNTWNNKKSREFYNVHGWSNSYFDINKIGQVTIKRSKYLADKPLPVIDIVNHIKKLGYNTPMVLRFTDIIQSRALRIIKAFYDTKKILNYAGDYALIYPIKVNQHQAIVESILNIKDTMPNRNVSDKNITIRGLEAGSKAELLAVLSAVQDNKTPIICNGYKDREYIKLALIARKCGRNITIVIEKMLEAKYIIELVKELQVEPLLGVRFRLALTLAGKWANSGGEKSKFGLNTTQILDLIGMLKKNNLLQYLHLLHCHQGSQIANLNDIFHYINELSTVYVELYKLNVPLNTIDIGGGLAVDYEGSRTRSFNSTNYSLSDYAHIIMSTIKQTAENFNIAVPNIYSESGRAVTAHHAVFVTDIVEVENIVGEEVPEVKNNDEDLLELEELLDSFGKLTANEIFSSSVLAIENIYTRFTDGKLSLEKRAIAEQLFSHIKIKIFKSLNRNYRSHRELYDRLDEDLAKKIIANFSLFQSMPDVWAIGQLFPVMPLTHLHLEPTMRAIIEDITCDSDGKIANYMDYQGNEPSLKLPKYNPKDPYLLAVFLVGAYQEIMGNLHNLFGPVTTVDIKLDNNGNFVINNIHEPFKNIDSLTHVNFDFNTMNKQFDKLVDSSKLDKSIKKELLEILRSALLHHTYLS